MADTIDYSYTYVVKEDGSVDYTAGTDGLTQNLSGLDLSSKEVLEQQLSDYTAAYVSGLAVASADTITIGDDIKVGTEVAAVAVTEDEANAPAEG